MNFDNTKKINVMHLICAWRDMLGGGDKVVLNLSSGLDKSKFKPVIVAFGDVKEVIPLLKAAQEKDISIGTVFSRGRYDVLSIFKLRHLLKKHKVDILHCHGYKSDVIGFIAALFTGVKLVTTLHGRWVGETLRQKTHNFFDIAVIKHFGKIATVSQAIKDILLEKKNFIGKVVVIPNSVDLEKFRETKDISEVRKNLHINPDARVVGIVGRLSIEKGHRYFLEAAAKIINNINDVVFLIVGEGPLKKDLIECASKLGIQDKVIFAGVRNDIPDIFAMLDIFVLPSLSEGLPMSLLEAMAAQKPIIATEVGGVPSVIKDRETGILIKPKSPEQLAEAINNLLSDKKLASEIAANARNLAEYELSIDSMAKKYEKVYFEILENGHKSK